MDKYTLDILTQGSVSIKATNEDGLIHRKAYVNSIKGREKVIQELSEDIQNEIFLVWGDIATIEEEIEIPFIDNTPKPPTTEERLQMAEETLMYLLMGGM